MFRLGLAKQKFVGCWWWLGLVEEKKKKKADGAIASSALQDRKLEMYAGSTGTVLNS